MSGRTETDSSTTAAAIPWQVLKAMRPHQWVKNCFVLAPLVFAEHALVTADVIRAAGAFALFSVLSGCVYILNDLVDVEGDRVHPTKRFRPIASGKLPMPAARLALAILLIATIGLSFAFGLDFAAIGLSYFVLNVGYSFALKHVPFVDVLCIASGFLLRLWGGAAAIDVPMTAWILVCTFLLAAYLGLGKRKHELLQAGSGAAKQRRVLSRYNLKHVRPAMWILAASTLACYVAFTLVGTQVGRLFDPRDLVWTIPCVVYGLFRFHQLTERSDEGKSPTDLMLKDRLFLLNIAAWCAVVVVVVYVL